MDHITVQFINKINHNISYGYLVHSLVTIMCKVGRVSGLVEEIIIIIKQFCMNQTG